VRYLSVCSGIEAASVAWHHLGWTPVAFSEVDPFPCAVLKHHYPDVPNVGDMTKFKEWNIEPGSIDLLVGGTPCQSFSVAGLRKGLDDPRGNLMLTYLAIARQYRPRWLVWENVPGVLSSNGGLDFASLLRGMGECGYGFAYRILDAQYFGVPQRRRRVFVVGYLGNWRAAAAVLFERHSLSGHPAPSREKGKEVAASTGFSVTGSVTSGYGPKLGTDESCQGSVIPHPCPVAFGMDGDVMQGEILETMTTREGDITDTSHAVMQPIGIFQDSEFGVAQYESAGTLRAGRIPDYQMVMQPISIQDVTPREKAQNGKGWSDDGTSYTVDTHATQGVMQPIFWSEELTASIDLAGTIQRGGAGGRHDGVAQPVASENGDIASTLRTGGNDHADIYNSVATAMQVRRLTPVECERLQGFPDNYTAIPWRKKPADQCPDGPRYKALGNSMAVPVMAWIGKRIQEFEAGNAS